MGLQGQVSMAAPGLLGFDTPNPLNPALAQRYFNQGYRFCLRYVSHAEAPSTTYTDLTASEAQGIIDAGLALMIVQHPPLEGWVANAQVGEQFGRCAAAHSKDAGLPAGVNVWMDLEGIKTGTSASDVIAFCNAWIANVEAAGYVSGVYIGANPILTADQLYWDVKTKHYWRGGSSVQAGVSADIPPRGYQLVQRVYDAGKPNEFDSDYTQTDNFGTGVLWISKNPAPTS